jgi:hypothetical protein
MQPDHRTPDENMAEAAHRARVQLVLDQAVVDGTSLLTAITLGEPADVIERWVNTLWDGLRDGLSDDHPDDPDSLLRAAEDRLLAIVLLLEPVIQAKALAVAEVPGNTVGAE